MHLNITFSPFMGKGRLKARKLSTATFYSSLVTFLKSSERELMQ